MGSLQSRQAKSLPKIKASVSGASLNNAPLSREVNHTRIAFFGGVGNYFTINHLLNTGIQCDRLPISEFIVRMTGVPKFSHESLKERPMRVLNMPLFDTELVENDMLSIQWSYRGFRGEYYPNLVFLLIPATYSENENSERLNSQLSFLSRFNLVDERHPNVVAILLFSCSISYENVDRWEKKMEMKKKTVQAVILKVLKVIAPVVLLENNYGKDGHNLDVFGNFTRLPNGVLQPKNVYEACEKLLRRNNDSLGLIALNTWFTKQNKMVSFSFYRQDSFSQRIKTATVPEVPNDLKPEEQKEGHEQEFKITANTVSLESDSVLERETQKLVEETVKCGEKKNNRISVLFIGQDGVGKTSLKKSLFGEESGDKEASTVGIEFDVIEVKDNNKHETWQRAADQQYIASEEYKNLVLGKEVARKITESLKESEAKGKESEEFGDNNGVQNEKVTETLDQLDSASEAVTVESYYEQVDESESVKDEGRDGADMESDSRDNGEGNNDNQGSTKDQDDYFMSDDLKRKIRESVENYNEDAMDTIRFLFGDTGGQSVFYDVHSLMLRLRSLYIFVFDLERRLDAEAQSKFLCEQTKEVREIKNRLKETNLDYMKKWAGALRNLDSQHHEKTEKKSARSSDMPKIIAVFTKPDKLGNIEEVKQKAETALMTSFRDIGCESLIVGTYVIKNTLPRSEAQTRELVRLREKIFETAQEILKAQDKTPVSWLELERAFSDRLTKSKGNPCITLDEAEKLAEEFEVKETFGQAMEFFHEENIVVHFGGHQPSSNLVVLDPAWLVKVLTQVITVPPDPNSGGAVKAAWNDLETKGVLCSKNLPVVLKGHGQEEALMNMMVRAGLICHWKEDTYFVPNMVTKGMKEQQIQNVLSYCLQPSLYIDFQGDCIPLGFYTRFQLEFIKWAKIDEDEEDVSAPPEFTCNFSRFTKKENGVGYGVILVRRITRIQVAILAKEWGEIATSVLSFVRGTMNVIRSTYPNYRGMRFKVGLKCDLCCEETTPCARHQMEGCTDDDCVCILSLRHLLTEFPTCKRNQLNKRSFSELNKSPWAQAEEVDKRIQDTIPPTMQNVCGVLDPRKYSVVKQIGCGSCSKVYFCQTKDRLQNYAVKQVDLGVNGRETQQKVKDLKKEIEILKRLSHNNIVAFYFYDRTAQTLSIFMEYVCGGSIADYVIKNGEMQENLVRKYTNQILKGCEYLHQNNVIHRDIKGANVLIDDTKSSIRLAGFGIAKDLQTVVTSTGSTTDERFCGTIYWCSPEQLRNEDPTYVFDIWSVGCTVVEMLTTKPPHRHLDFFQAMHSILNKVFHPPDQLSSLAKTFIELCLKKKEERPNATDLLKNEFPAEYVPEYGESCS